jgi:hypothetical protein
MPPICKGKKEYKKEGIKRPTNQGLDEISFWNELQRTRRRYGKKTTR